MSKPAQMLPEHSHAIPSKSQREDLAASDRAQPLDPGAILQRAALAPESLRPADILRLQQTLGNRAVGRLLSQRSPVRSLIQAKLTVNAPSDRYEQEADRVAEEVIQTPAVQRAELKDEEDEDEPPEVMTKRAQAHAAGGAFAAGEAFEQGLQAARGQGRPLTPALKEDFETKFGADFSGVRVHTDAPADQLNRSIQAVAFTTGPDLFFQQGVYDPGSREGQKLIAHELTHVLQQQAGGGAAVASVQRMPEDSDDEEEDVEGMRAGEAEHNPCCGLKGGNDESVPPPKLRPLPVPPPKLRPLPVPPPKLRPLPVPPPTPAAPTITSDTVLEAPDRTADTRTEVGVGEKVTFTGSEPGEWTSTSGGPLTLESGTTLDWTAPDRAKDVTIKLEVGSKSTTLTMKVLEPTSVTAGINSTIDFERETAGAGMRLRFFYYPMSVSFSKVEAKEVSGPATNIKGYFAKKDPAKLAHNSGDKFFMINPNNRSVELDTACANFKPHYEDGTVDWDIPYNFRTLTEDGDGKTFTTVTQSFLIDREGTVTISKAGASVTRTVSSSVKASGPDDRQTPILTEGAGLWSGSRPSPR